MPRGVNSLSRYVLAGFCALTGACASVPAGKYGVSTIEVDGVERLDEAALLACLATHKRPRFGFGLGPYPDPECGTPPFDTGPIPVELWSWPWTDWPVYEQASLERDLERIERWYRARGFYQAEVTKYQAIRDESDREVEIKIAVTEGEPVIVKDINLVGIERLARDVRRQARDAISLTEGGRLKESHSRGNCLGLFPIDIDDSGPPYRNGQRNRLH